VLIGINDESLHAGARKVEAALREALEVHGLSKEIEVIDTGDLGASGQGVVLSVHPDGVLYTRVTAADVADIVSEHLLKGRPVERLRFVPEGTDAGKARRRPRIVLENCGVIDPHSLEQAIAVGAYAAMAKIVETSMRPIDVIDLVKASGLRGRGGAGFPTGLKWSFTAKNEQVYIICNADEGEPGTFKDRLILEGDPHRLIEGMMIAGYAVGANKGYVYVRGEYALSIERMQTAIDVAREAGLLGGHILESDFSFDIEIKKGAGAYVCGEETSLIESMEGKRGYPRLKPPYPGAVGFWSKPTVVNNVETLANVPPIILHGADWFRSYGTASCPGTKVFTILGHVERPGLVEAEMGTSLQTIIDEYGGGVKDSKAFKGALIGGAAGAFVCPDCLDKPMDFDGLKELSAVLGSGAILVFNEDASIVEMLDGILAFFKHESCGQCVPCRAGTRALKTIMGRVRDGNGQPGDLEQMVSVASAMQATSLCPLGQSVILPITSALQNFRSEFEALIG
jgi:NADH:ubiquinone oxidoreductase subunit F (NADH-binding)/(2Fe-2S) ferredoxin